MRARAKPPRALRRAQGSIFYRPPPIRSAFYMEVCKECSWLERPRLRARRAPARWGRLSARGFAAPIHVCPRNHGGCDADLCILRCGNTCGAITRCGNTSGAITRNADARADIPCARRQTHCERDGVPGTSASGRFRAKPPSLPWPCAAAQAERGHRAARMERMRLVLVRPGVGSNA